MLEEELLSSTRKECEALISAGYYLLGKYSTEHRGKSEKIRTPEELDQFFEKAEKLKRGLGISLDLQYSPVPLVGVDIDELGVWECLKAKTDGYNLIYNNGNVKGGHVIGKLGPGMTGSTVRTLFGGFSAEIKTKEIKILGDPNRTILKLPNIKDLEELPKLYRFNRGRKLEPLIKGPILQGERNSLLFKVLVRTGLIGGERRGFAEEINQLFCSPVLGPQEMLTVSRDIKEVDEDEPDAFEKTRVINKNSFESRNNDYQLLTSELKGRYVYNESDRHFYEYNGVIYEKLEPGMMEIKVVEVLSRSTDNLKQRYTSSSRARLVVDLVEQLQHGLVVTRAMKDFSAKTSFVNGVYDNNTSSLTAHNPHLFVTSFINATYDDKEDLSAISLKFLMDVTGSSPVGLTLIRLMFYNVMFDRCESQTGFVMWGAPGTGKSTLASLIQLVVGETYAPLELGDLESSFNRDIVVQARTLLLNEVSNLSKKQKTLLKQMIGRDEISFHEKHRQGQRKGVCKAVVVGTSNENYDAIFEGDPALEDRIFFIEFFPSMGERDPHLLRKLEANMSGFFNWVSGCDKELLADTIRAGKLNAYINEGDNPMIRWMSERLVWSEGADTPVITLVKDYQRYCAHWGQTPEPNSTKVRKLIESHLRRSYSLEAPHLRKRKPNGTRVFVFKNIELADGVGGLGMPKTVGFDYFKKHCGLESKLPHNTSLDLLSKASKPGEHPSSGMVVDVEKVKNTFDSAKQATPERSVKPSARLYPTPIQNTSTPPKKTTGSYGGQALPRPTAIGLASGPGRAVASQDPNAKQATPERSVKQSATLNATALASGLRPERSVKQSASLKLGLPGSERSVKLERAPKALCPDDIQWGDAAPPEYRLFPPSINLRRELGSMWVRSKTFSTTKALLEAAEGKQLSKLSVQEASSHFERTRSFFKNEVSIGLENLDDPPSNFYFHPHKANELYRFFAPRVPFVERIGDVANFFEDGLGHGSTLWGQCMSIARSENPGAINLHQDKKQAGRVFPYEYSLAWDGSFRYRTYPPHTVRDGDKRFKKVALDKLENLTGYKFYDLDASAAHLRVCTAFAPRTKAPYLWDACENPDSWTNLATGLRNSDPLAQHLPLKLLRKAIKIYCLAQLNGGGLRSPKHLESLFKSNAPELEHMKTPLSNLLSEQRFCQEFHETGKIIYERGYVYGVLKPGRLFPREREEGPRRPELLNHREPKGAHTLNSLVFCNLETVFISYIIAFLGSVDHVIPLMTSHDGLLFASKSPMSEDDRNRLTKDCEEHLARRIPIAMSVEISHHRDG